MGMLAQTFIEAIIQIIIFTSVPFLWWLISSRKKIGFFEWMGLKRFDNSNSNKTLLWVVSVAFTIYFDALLSPQCANRYI